MESARFPHGVIFALLLAGCGSSAREVRSNPPAPATLDGLPAEIQARLELIRRFQRDTHCERYVPPKRGDGMYTMEPPNTSYSGGPSDCDKRKAAAFRLATDMTRIYGGCDLCISDCSAGDPRAVPDCRAACDLGSIADHDAHQAAFAKLFGASDQGFHEWRRLVERLPPSPLAPDQPLHCVGDPTGAEGDAPQRRRTGT